MILIIFVGIIIISLILENERIKGERKRERLDTIVYQTLEIPNDLVNFLRIPPGFSNKLKREPIHDWMREGF